MVRYVRTLPGEELERIRFHTYFMTSDTAMRYLYAQTLKPLLIPVYDQLAAELSDFRPTEMANGFGFETLDGKVITSDLLRYMLVLRDLYKGDALSRTEPMTILEIGGGFGGLARLVLLFNENVSYVLCDLEEIMFFQAVYLTQSFGPERVHLLEGSEDARIELQPGHVYFMPQHRSERLRSLAFDLAVNQMGLEEMTVDQVEYYCTRIPHMSLQICC